MSSSTNSPGGLPSEPGPTVGPASSSRTSDATVLMEAAARGDPDGVRKLLPLVYEQLRRSAQAQLSSEQPGQTLSATALVHEAYLRLAGPRDVPWANRAHFFAAAAEAMRRIVIDRARSRKAARGHRQRWHEARDLAEFDAWCDSDEIVAFDEALRRLEDVDRDAVQVVRLRFFAGLSVDETAQALGVSPRTVDREWAFARSWLLDAMKEQRG